MTDTNQEQYNENTAHLAQLLIRRQELGRYWAQRLSHGLDATTALDAIVEVERRILSWAPDCYRSAGSFWARRDAALLHRPWETLRDCGGCTSVVRLDNVDLRAETPGSLCVCQTCGHHADHHRSRPGSSGPDVPASPVEEILWGSGDCAVLGCGCATAVPGQPDC